MENKRPPRPNFSKLAQGLLEKERKRNSPHDVTNQGDQKLNPDKRHNKHPPIQNSQRLGPLRPPQQQNLLEDKRTAKQQSEVVKKKNNKPALYKPEPSTKDSSDPRDESEMKPTLESSSQPSSTWDEEIKINTKLIPEVEDFIAFEKSNATFKYVAEEESEVYKTPWFDPNAYNLKLSPTDRLQMEVTSLIEYLSPTPAEIAVRKWLCDSVEQAAQSVFPTATVNIFGSFSTQLFLPTSDVDLVVSIPDLAGEENVVPCLRKIAKALSKKLDIVHLDVRSKAKVPIINFLENQSELEVDISLNMDSGLASRTLIRDFMDQCPAIRPLIMIVKHFMDLKELNKVFNGGLGSYAITLLVISFLQVRPHQAAVQAIG
ncbi:Poly(A) polymerase [Entomophthora muscae]|uniref:Poly(A) polymerase n=1 Tax=Entomophthora muscae TaxID=34485 RepID=A0ACC2TF24_9FUNG|nr:Poly(A) polymerase [Entomophthora muscae]